MVHCETKILLHHPIKPNTNMMIFYFSIQFLCAAETDCTSCAPGRYSILLGATYDDCKQCKAGTYSPNQGSSSSVSCQPCTAGRYSTEGAPQCLDCDLGKFNSGVGKPSCELCPQRYYGDRIGLTTCFVCPPGRITPSTGATALVDCLDPKVSEIKGKW